MSRDDSPRIQIGVLVKKCVCRKKPCECGSHDPRFINPEEHQKFVNNMFDAINRE